VVIEEHRAAAVRAGTYSAVFSGSGELFVALATSGAVVAGVVFGVDGAVTAGTVVAFLFLIQLFIEPVLIATEVINEGQTAVAGWRRVLDVLDVAPDVADPEDGVTLPPGPIEVTFDHVSFRYPAPGELAGEASGPGRPRRRPPRHHAALPRGGGGGDRLRQDHLRQAPDPADGPDRGAGADRRGADRRPSRSTPCAPGW
jgi:ATP-binding cassette, subfamily B, bacterial